MVDELKSDGDNDPYALIERAAEILWERSQQAVEKLETDRVSDLAVSWNLGCGQEDGPKIIMMKNLMKQTMMLVKLL